MSKLFAKNLGFFLVVNLLVKPIYVFGIDRVVQNTVGLEVYGSYFPLLNLVLIFQIVLDLGIENYTRKEVAGNPGLTRRLLSNLLLVKIILAVFFVALFTVIGAFISETQFEWRLLVLLLINQSMSNFILYMRANMGGLQIFKSETMVSVLDRAIMIIVCGALLIVPFTRLRFKMEWFVLAQTIAYATTLLVSLIVVLRKTGMITLSFRLKTLLPILKQLIPYALLVLLMSFYYRTDSIFLRFLLDDGREQAGIFAQGFRIMDFMSNYALIFSFVLLPTFAKLLRKKERAAPLLKTGSLALIIPSISLLLGIFFYRIDVFDLLYKSHIQESANVFAIMGISFLGICISYTFGALLTANGNIKELNYMAAIAVALSVALNVLLTPRYKAMGAATANALAQTFTILYHVVMVKKKLNIGMGVRHLVKISAFLAFSVLVGTIIVNTELKWYYGAVLITSFSMLFSVIIKLLKPQYLIGYLKPDKA